MATTLQKWGNSLGIRVPKSVAEQFDLKSGTEVEFDTSGDALTIRPKRKRKHKLASLLARAKGPSPHRALMKDGPRGRELL
jgi:antitoxin MazE